MHSSGTCGLGLPSGHPLFLAAWTAECPSPPASTKPSRTPHKPEDLTVRNTRVCGPPLVLASTVSQCRIAVPHLSKRGHHLDTGCSPAPKPPSTLHILKSKYILTLTTTFHWLFLKAKRDRCLGCNCQSAFPWQLKTQYITLISFALNTSAIKKPEQGIRNWHRF